MELSLQDCFMYTFTVAMAMGFAGLLLVCWLMLLMNTYEKLDSMWRNFCWALEDRKKQK